MGTVIKALSGAGGLLLALLLIVTFCLMVKAVKYHAKVLKETKSENSSTIVTCELLLMFFSQLIPAFGIGIVVSWFVCFGYESKWFEEIDKKRLKSLSLLALAVFLFLISACAFFGWVVVGLVDGTMQLTPDM